MKGKKQNSRFCYVLFVLLPKWKFPQLCTYKIQFNPPPIYQFIITVFIYLKLFFVLYNLNVSRAFISIHIRFYCIKFYCYFWIYNNTNLFSVAFYPQSIAIIVRWQKVQTHFFSKTLKNYWLTTSNSFIACYEWKNYRYKSFYTLVWKHSKFQVK